MATWAIPCSQSNDAAVAEYADDTIDELDLLPVHTEILVV
jgi:hypothetical protein